MPALNDSPRSIRGTTRTIAYSKGFRGCDGRGAALSSGGTGTIRLLDEAARPLEPAQQVVDVPPACSAVIGLVRRCARFLEPALGDEVDDVGQHGFGDTRGKPSVGVRDPRRIG